MSSIIANAVTKKKKEMAEKEKELSALRQEHHYLKSIEEKVANCNGDQIKEVIVCLQTGFMDLDEVEEFDVDDNIMSKEEFWAAYVEAGYEIRLESLAWLHFSYTRTSHRMSSDDFRIITSTNLKGRKWKLIKQLGKFDSNILDVAWNAMCEADATTEEQEEVQKDIAETKAQLAPHWFFASWSGRLLVDEHAHLFVACLEKLPIDDPYVSSKLQSNISGPCAERIWENREVVLAWGRRGGPFLHDQFPEELQHDEEVVNVFSERGNFGVFRPPVEERIPDHLRADKAYMLDKIGSHPVFIKQIDNSLVGDKDLLYGALRDKRVLAAASGAGWMRWCEGEEYFRDAATDVRDGLRKHKVFVEVVLASMTLGPASAHDTKKLCPLALIQGHSDLKQHIAEHIAGYLGIPLGNELQILREMSDTLELFGFHTKAD